MPDHELALTLKTPIFSASMKVPLLSLVATETDELKRKETVTHACQVRKNSLSQYWPHSERHSRYNLGVIDQILQRVSAGEVIVEVGGVAD